MTSYIISLDINPGDHIIINQIPIKLWNEIEFNKEILKLAEKYNTSYFTIGILTINLIQGFNIQIHIAKTNIEKFIKELINYLDSLIENIKIKEYYINLYDNTNEYYGNEFVITFVYRMEYEDFIKNKSKPNANPNRLAINTLTYSHDMTLWKIKKDKEKNFWELQ